jgi:hypothetical protein
MHFMSLLSEPVQELFVVERQGLADIAAIESDMDRADASFEWTGPNFSIGEEGQIRRANPLIGVVLMIADFDNFRIHGKFADGIVDPQVAADVRENSTFILEQGRMDPSQVSFRSKKFPDLFIRQRERKLFAQSLNAPIDVLHASFTVSRALLGPAQMERLSA